MKRIALVLTTVAAFACIGCAGTSSSRASEINTLAASEVEVLALKHVDATSAAERLQKEHGDAKIVAVVSNNALVISGSRSQVEAIREAVGRIDIPG